MNPEIFAVFTVPLSIMAIVLGFFTFVYKSRERKLETLVKIVELGGNPDPELMKLLSQDTGGYKQDFKYGLIWLAVGIPISLGMYLDEGAGAAVFGLVPVFVGIAYLISGKYRLRDKS